jgi:hypothetical protein
MTERTIDLDQHRGMAAQKATDLRRLLADVEANAKALRLRQDELEAHLLAAPAANWREAAEKARYLLNLFAASLAAQDPRRQKLISAVLDDFERLARDIHGLSDQTTALVSAMIPTPALSSSCCPPAKPRPPRVFLRGGVCIAKDGNERDRNQYYRRFEGAARSIASAACAEDVDQGGVQSHAR